MNVLGIETATGVCGAALAVNGVIAAVEEIDRQKIHAEKLVSLVTAVLRAGGITPRDLDGIAVSIGPGSFTGLRIGLSAAKGLAYATGVPLLAVPTLEALANRAERDGILPSEGWLCAALDARGEPFAPKGPRPMPRWRISLFSSRSIRRPRSCSRGRRGRNSPAPCPGRRGEHP
jgi:tRNA threonylcarbamoyladenosine biosynthesis protein TsaB